MELRRGSGFSEDSEDPESSSEILIADSEAV